MASNEVRIIGGKWRGRKLVFPDRPDLRPTLGRVRETLFNWLRADVPGSRCLDLFAGSGALGFEAASLGAAEVYLVDADRQVTRALTANAQRLSAHNVNVVCDRAQRFLEREPAPWDIIFVDPPFQLDLLAPTLQLIAATDVLAPQGLVYLELPRRAVLPADGWRQLKHGQAGEIQFGLLAHA